MKRVASAGRKCGNTCGTDSKRGWTGGKRGKSHMTNDNGLSRHHLLHMPTVLGDRDKT